MTKDELKQILRNAPTIEATFATVDEELAKVRTHFDALRQRHAELSQQMVQIASARAELSSTGEPVPASPPATKPKGKGTDKC